MLIDCSCHHERKQKSTVCGRTHREIAFIHQFLNRDVFKPKISKGTSKCKDLTVSSNSISKLMLPIATKESSVADVVEIAGR